MVAQQHPTWEDKRLGGVVASGSPWAYSGPAVSYRRTRSYTRGGSRESP